MIYYLDHAAATPLHPEASAALSKFRNCYGNPSSNHPFGRERRKQIEEAREKIAETIGAEPSEIIFTSGATEGNKTILNTFTTEKAITFSARIEHDSILKHTDYPEMPVGKDGKIDPIRIFNQTTYYRAQGYEKVLYAVGIINNEIGVVQDIKKLAEEVHRAGGFILADASAAIGHIHIDVKNMDVDYLTASGEKFGALSGTGFIYVKQSSPFTPLLQGTQENGNRGGTENTLGIITMGAAIHNPSYEEICMRETQYRVFKNALETKLHEKKIQYRINSISDTVAMSGILSISFKDIESDCLLAGLEGYMICASAGSACHSGDKTISSTLKAIGTPEEFAKGTIRFSLGTQDRLNVDEITDRIVMAVQELKAVG